MINYSVSHQESYSRGQLLLRTLFGWLYIAIPHVFLLAFVGIWAAILQFFAWWAVLFTGVYPKGWFEFQIKVSAWHARVAASLYNLTDEYPAFGPSGSSDTVTFDIPYPATLSRGKLLLRAFFGIFYIYIPHGFCLYFRFIGAAFVAFIAWWVVLFTGNYPAAWHGFVNGTFRWAYRLYAYAFFLSDTYPPFSGKE